MTIKFGLLLSAVNPKFWSAAAQAAEDAGFESAWLPEHLVLPVKMSGSPHTGHDEPPITASAPTFDPFVAFGLLAGQTATLKFGTCVYNVGLRHPFVTARAVATLDVLSEGRVILGVGASWLKEEWDAAGLDFTTRGRRVDEALQVCRRLWTEDVVEHHGEFFDFEAIGFAPKPVNGPPPLLIGGDSPAALRRTALFGDGWLPMNHALADLAGSVQQILKQRSHTGFVQVTLNSQVRNLADAERHINAGVHRAIVAPFASSREALDGIRRFGDEVIAPLT